MAFNSKEYHRRYYLEHVEELKEKSRQRFRNDHRWHLLKGASDRSKKAGLPFNLKVNDIVIPEICPIFLVPLIIKTRYAPSLDRLEPAKGYVKGNVQVISLLANQMKSNATVDELRKFAEWVKTL